MTDRFLVFVYGTLKKGFPNHDRYMPQADLVGTFRTRERYRLVLNGDRFSPCLLAGAGQGQRVVGEVYAVDGTGLDRMDRLERVDRPDGYRRHRITVDRIEDPVPESCEVFVYLKNPEWVDDPRSKPLETYTPEAARLYRRRNEKDVPMKPKPHDQPDPAARELETLRKAIDAIDHDMVALLKERQEQVDRVLALKRAHGLPVYHPAREENLISEKRRTARAVGLDLDFLEDIFRRILRQSRVEQTAQLARRGIKPGARILLVGGAGAMGRYLHRWFTDAGYRVRTLDRKDWHDAAALCNGIELALLSVPIGQTAEVIQQLAPHLPPDCLLSDITSLKAAPLAAMLDAHPGPVVGLHPLFGPATTSMDKQVVITSPGRRAPECQWLLDQFTDWGAIVIQADPAEHDAAMDVIQALRHFAAFTFGKFLFERRIALDRTLEFSSPIYRLELGMVGRLFAQDPALYSEIILASPERRQLLRDYLASLQDSLSLIESGNKTAFENLFRKIAAWFDPFSGQALRETTFLIDKLIERF
jgi:chorismate mutase/prephenate dehydrogenase